MLGYLYDLRFVDFLQGLCVFGDGNAVGGSCDPKVCELSSCPRPRSLSLSVVGGGARIGGAHSSVLMDEWLTFALVNTRLTENKSNNQFFF